MDYTHLQKLVTLIIGYPLPKFNDNKKISNFGKGRHTHSVNKHMYVHATGMLNICLNNWVKLEYNLEETWFSCLHV